MDSEQQAIDHQRMEMVREVATAAELEVLVMRVEGYTYREIAARLRDNPQPAALRRRWFRLRQKVAKQLMGGEKR